MLNHIVIMGRLTKDPELRTTQNQIPVASFTVAVERDGKDKATDFIDVVAWRATGEFVSKYFSKGQMIVVSGHLQSRKWQTREGENRTNWEINADRVYFGEAKRSDGYAKLDGGAGDGYSAGEPRYTQAPPMNDMGYGSYGTPFDQQAYQTEIGDDGELPF